MSEPRLDPAQLLMQAVNDLSRCKALLLANEPMYTFALHDLDAARTALVALAAVDTVSVH